MRLGPPDLRNEAEDFYVGHTLDAALRGLLAQAALEVCQASRRGEGPSEDVKERAGALVREFARSLPAACWTPTCWPPGRAIRRRAASMEMVLVLSPGVLAMFAPAAQAHRATTTGGRAAAGAE